MPRKTKNPKDQPSIDPAPKLEGRFAYSGLERVIHERSRLGILASLAAHSAGLVFNDLKALTALTDGNLSRQIQILQEEGLIDVWKGYKNNRPQTLCRLTESGRQRFLEYINVLESVVADAETTLKRLREGPRDLHGLAT